MAGSDINIRIGAKLDGLQQGIKKAQAELTRFADFAEATGRDLTTRLTLPIVGVGVAAVASFAKFERMELGLKALADEGENTAETMARLQKIALLPGIGLEQAINGANQLRTVGFEAAQAEEILKGLSKAVTISGAGPEQLQSVIRQFTQMSSKGRILQEDLSIILENVPSVGIAIQDAFGTQNIDKIKATGVSTQQFIAEIIKAIDANEKFQKAQGGVANELENFGLAVNFALAGLGKTIAESINLSGILQSLSGAIQGASDRFQALSPGVRKTIIVIAGAAAAIGPLIFGLGAAIKVSLGFAAAVRLVGGAFSTLFLNPVGLAILAIASITAGLIYAYNNSEKFRAAVAGLGAGLKAFAVDAQAAANELLSADFEKGSTRMRTFFGRETGKAAGDEFATAYAESVNKGLGDKIKSFAADVKKAAGELLNADFEAAGDRMGAFFGRLAGENAASDFSAAYKSKIASESFGFGKGIGVLKQPAPTAENTLSLFGRLPNTTDKKPTKPAGTNLDEIFGSLPKSPTTAGVEIAPIRATTAEYARQALTLTELVGIEQELAFVRANKRPAGIIQATAAIESQTAAVAGLNAELSRPIADIGARFEQLPAQVSFAQESLATYAETLAGIDEKTLAFGASFDTLGAKISATKAAIDEAFADGFTTASETIQKLLKELQELTLIENLANGIYSLGAAIGKVAAEGALSFQSFAKAAVSAIGEVIGVLIQQGVAAAVANAFKNPVGIVPPLGAALAVGAGLAAAGLFKGLLNSIPGLKDGGIIPPGFSGDKFPAFLNSGEAVIPLDRLFNELGSGGGSGEFVVRGQDLILVMDRANNNSRRINGR